MTTAPPAPRTSTTRSASALLSAPTAEGSLAGPSIDTELRAAATTGDELVALRIAYSDIATIVASLSEDESWLPTRRTGWSVRDLIAHLLADVRRALVALASPAAGPADRDAVTWWATGEPPADPESRDLRRLRAVASAWDLDDLAESFLSTTRGVVSLASRTAPDTLVVAHGHALEAADLIATLVVKAAVHHLDMVAELRRPAPRAEPLALVRRTLDALLGHPAPAEWSDERWALLGTGRVPPGGGERRILGPAAGRLPLLT